MKPNGYPFTAAYDGGSFDWPADVPFPIPEGEREKRFEIKDAGGFHRPIVSIGGLAVSYPEIASHAYAASPLGNKVTVHGPRTMYHPRESGYQMEGRVSVNGRKVRAFTADVLVRYQGKLYTFAALHVCFPRKKEAAA